MTHPDTLPSSVTETPETDSDRVSGQVTDAQIRDCLATCSRAPHPKAPDAASNLRHHMQAIERDLYEVRDLLAALTLRTPPTSAQAHDDAIRKAAGVARFAREQVLAANQHERAYAVECVEREILSLLSDAPKATHRHKKRGTESVLVGVALACVRLGGDERVLDVIFERARERLAELRLKDIEAQGNG